MKKITLSLLAFSLCSLLLFAGCSKQESETKDISVSDLAKELSEQISFEDKMSPVDKEAVSYLYQFEDGVISEQAVYESTGATAEEIAVFKASSAQKAETVKKAIDARIASQKQGFENYVPKELTKLENPVIEVKGSYVVLCVSNDNKKAEEIIDGHFGS